MNTDFSDKERFAHMFAYIRGDNALNRCETVQSKWDRSLTEDDINQIIEELSEKIEDLLEKYNI